MSDKKKTGRPKIEIDQKQFENLCALHCTEEEVSDFFFCDRKTIIAWCRRTYGEDFSTMYKKFSHRGNISLRRSQMEIAKHNASMAIFLGKQYLGQKDIVDEDPRTQKEELAEIVGQIERLTDGANG